MGHIKEAWCDRAKRRCTHPVAEELEVFRGGYNQMRQATATRNKSTVEKPWDPLLQV